jgi:hypothetical protein
MFAVPFLVSVGLNNDKPVTRSLRLDVVLWPFVESHANRETNDEISNYLCKRPQDRRFCQLHSPETDAYRHVNQYEVILVLPHRIDHHFLECSLFFIQPDYTVFMCEQIAAVGCGCDDPLSIGHARYVGGQRLRRSNTFSSTAWGVGIPRRR